MTDDVLIELDGRRRASLSKLGTHDRYLAHAEDDGTIVLVPAVVLSASEARFHAGHADLEADMEQTWRQPGSRVPRPVRPARQEAATG